VFGLCHLLDFRFAPRIKDLKDRKLYAIEKPGTYPLLEPLIGDMVDTAAVVSPWAVLMRLKASIQAGTVMPSVIWRLSPERRATVVEARRNNPNGTQQEIARAAGVSRATVSRIERGDCRVAAVAKAG
jgi:TnpA family transposase